MGGQAPERLGRLEVLGAWLGVWTPPRDAVVPPVPWRAIAVGSVVLVVVVGAAAALFLPGIVQDRQAAEGRERRAAAERYAATLASAEREQRPQRGRARADPGEGATPARRMTARSELLVSAETGIARDAAARTGRRIRGVDCEPFPRTLDDAAPVADLSRRAAAYDCVAVTARFDRGSPEAGKGIIGIPFRLVARFASGKLAAHDRGVGRPGGHEQSGGDREADERPLELERDGEHGACAFPAWRCLGSGVHRDHVGRPDRLVLDEVLDRGGGSVRELVGPVPRDMLSGPAGKVAHRLNQPSSSRSSRSSS